MTHSRYSQTSIVLPSEGKKGPEEDDGKRNHRDPETPSCASQGVYDWMIFSGNGLTVHLAIPLLSGKRPLVPWPNPQAIERLSGFWIALKPDSWDH